MWRAGLLLVVGLAVLAGNRAAHSQPVPGTAPSPPDTAILHRLMAEGAMDKPLLPQPGNIWAGAMAGDDSAGTALPQPAPARESGGKRVAAAPAPVALARRESAGGAQVQLGAAASAQGAMAAWHRLRLRQRALTNGHEPAIVQAEVKGHMVWRLRTSGFADTAAAAAFCARIRSDSGKCFVVPTAAR